MHAFLERMTSAGEGGKTQRKKSGAGRPGSGAQKMKNGVIVMEPHRRNTG
jgi:hypothetical protein